MAVEIHSLYKFYDDVRAIEDLSLAVSEGSIFGLVGPNGAGKSTLIQMLIGIVRPDRGEINLLGRNIRDRGGSIRQKVGYVPDVPVMYPSFTMEEMFGLGSRLYESWDWNRCRELVRSFELPLDQRVRNLSRGQKVQGALVMALSIRPRLLILDEPTAGLDPVIRRGFLHSIIEEAADSGCTVFYSTHNLSDLEQSADHIAALFRGRLLFSHPLDELKESFHRLRVVFEGEVPLDWIKTIPGLIDLQAKGRVCTLTVNGDLDMVEQKLRGLTPVLLERVDLSLEDMFIGFMKGMGYSFDINRGSRGWDGIWL